MQIWLIFLLLAVDYIPFKAIFRLFFPTSEDFNESVRYYFTPDVISLFRGEYWQDRAAQFRLGLFILVCGSIFAAEYALIIKLLRVLGLPV